MNRPAYWDDPDYQDAVVALLLRDKNALGQCGDLLAADDFKPIKGHPNGRARWIIAERALDYYKKHHEPIGKLIRADALRYVEKIGLGERQAQEIEDYLQKALKRPLIGTEDLVEKVVNYKRLHLQSIILGELEELQAAGSLTPEKWRELSERIYSTNGSSRKITDYFATYEERFERQRQRERHLHHPYFLIDPLDLLLGRGIGPGQLGLLIGPPKRGKSMFFTWLARSYTIQGLDGLYITLEDPKTEVESRLDACITELPIANIASEEAEEKERRFARFRRGITSCLKVWDGTDEAVTVPDIEAVLNQEHRKGFIPDYLIVDYDEEITPVTRNRDRRMDLDEIHRNLRKLGARYNMIVWTASQTNVKGEDVKILQGKHLAEDFGKGKKVGLAIGVGRGEWGEESFFLWVLYNKFGPMHRGCNIVSDKERMIFYDAEKTRRAAAQYAAPDSEEVLEDEFTK